MSEKHSLLFFKAWEAIVIDGEPTLQTIQRKIGVGAACAMYLMKELEREEVVTPFGDPCDFPFRKVLRTQWEKAKKASIWHTRNTPAASPWIHPVEGEPKTQPPRDGTVLLCLWEGMHFPSVAVFDTEHCTWRIIHNGRLLEKEDNPPLYFAGLDFTGAEKHEDAP